MDPDSNSPELQAANKSLRYSLKPLLRFIHSQRFINWLTHMRPPVTGPLYDAAGRDWVELDGVKALCITPHNAQHSDACILYFHGGAYTLGSPAASEPEARRLAINCAMPVYAAQYTTAIRAPYPAAMEDAEASYHALLARGFAPSRIVLAGTSAGGGLALGLLHRLLEKGDPLPACVVSLSPWLDLTLSFPSLEQLAKRDVILSRSWIARAGALYCSEQQRVHPEVSPIFGTFTGSPKQLLLYSKVELFRDEIEVFADTLQEQNVSLQLVHHNHAPHAWPVVAEQTPEAEAAFEVIADFVARRLSEVPT